MWEQVFAVAGVGVVPWAIVEFSGGFEARRQKRILQYIEISEGLGDCAVGREARKVAEADASALIGARSTTSRLVTYGIVGVLAGLVALLSFVGYWVDVDGTWNDWVGTFFVVTYGTGCAMAWVKFREVLRTRVEGRPREMSPLVLP